MTGTHSWLDRVHRPSRRLVTALVAALGLLLLQPQRAAAQDSITDVLSFLLTNRSIPTGDFAQDEGAAQATRDTISTFLLSELGTLPVSSSATAFTYRVDPALGGVPVRSTASFGPFFTERSLTAGTMHASFGVSFQSATFDRIDGRNLRDGTLVATASRFTSDPMPFDVEALSLRIHTDTVTMAANLGLTDRLEVGAALPIIRLTLSGERVDTYRGTPLLQAAGSATASGAGDLLLRTKYNVLRGDRSGVSVAAESRLPTGSTENLLGTGKTTLKPSLIGSIESDRVGLSGDLGYLFGGFSDELDYSGAVTVAGSQRFTMVGEIIGRRLDSSGRLSEVVTPHPSLVGVETVRLSSVEQATDRVVAVAGIKWNVASTWLITANVSRFLTTAGLTARWIPALSAEYSFGQ